MGTDVEPMSEAELAAILRNVDISLAQMADYLCRLLHHLEETQNNGET